jgi:hypothetical protein
MMRKLSAGETAVFDMKQVIDEQKPDYGKRLLPKNSQLGKFKWLVHGVIGGKIILTGRAEMVSRSQRISTSYSCAEGCINGYGGGISGNTLLTVGETYTMSAWEMAYTSAGNTYGPYPASGTWWSSNSSVITVNDAGACTAVAPGQAFIGFTSTPQYVYVWDGLNCYENGQQFWEDSREMQAKNSVELGNVNFSNPNPPVVPEGGIVTVTVPVAAAAANVGVTNCKVCIEPTEASAELVPKYPDGPGGRCSNAQDINPGATLGFTVRLQILSAGPPLPMTFKAKGMVEVTNPNVAEVKGTNPKATSNTATVQAP